MMRRYKLGVGERQFEIDVHELSDDRFQVVVGDASYEVKLTGAESLSAAAITPGDQPAGGAAPPPRARAAMPAAARPRAMPLAGGADALHAPMPGVILELHVQAGDTVQRGQQIAVLDAMKMHNFIGAPRAGVIAEVCVGPGQAVGHGEPIVRFVPD
jgi:glutaconyl-CoA/methylmalonyl-CoA decarboxylase subunit gamma